MKKKLSQVQIAKELGVSQSLVSIVLNGRREGIAQATYDRIWDFARSNGYSPKGMRMPDMPVEAGVTANSIGYFLRSPLRLATQSNFFSHVTQGLHEVVHKAGMDLVFIGSEQDFSPADLRSDQFKNRGYAGVVVLGQVQPDFLSAVKSLGKPLVYVSARSPGLCHSVNSNEYQATEQLVDHLYQLGHRSFAYLGCEHPRIRHEERLQGTRFALYRHGLEMTDDRVFSLREGERQEGYAMAESLLSKSLDPFPTAWICVNSLVARGAISCVFRSGLRLVDDVSIVAVDNTRICTEEVPSITGAAAVPEDLGRTAGRLIMESLNTEPESMNDVVLPSTLFERETSGPAPDKLSKRVQALVG